MSDASVEAALRSDVPLVVVEAPAGCGKTRQGADYAREMARARTNGRPLVVTHTHAARSVFAERTADVYSQVEIKTIDAVIAQIASVYHSGLGLPADLMTWLRTQDNGHARIAAKVASLLRRHSMIADVLARRHPIVICDEHQDSNEHQHAVILALLARGAKVRVFGDSMQRIFKESRAETKIVEWEDILAAADAIEELDYPHRWDTGCSQLGQWTMVARSTLKNGGKLDLRRGTVPPSVTVVVADNVAQAHAVYALSGSNRRPVDQFVTTEQSLLVLSRHNDTTRSLRAFFNRRIPLWEGHLRPCLERLVADLSASQSVPDRVAASVARFLEDVGKGLSPSAFGNTFQNEVRTGCTARRRGKPAVIQELARLIVAEPNHMGAAKLLRRLLQLTGDGGAFSDVAIDCQREYWDAIKLGEAPDAERGMAMLAQRRAYVRAKPPSKAISTIHKAKGLECDRVALLPVDATTFPDKPDARCLLYVAISRAKHRLLVVASRMKPSPLLILDAPSSVSILP